MYEFVCKRKLTTLASKAPAWSSQSDFEVLIRQNYSNPGKKLRNVKLIKFRNRTNMNTNVKWKLNTGTINTFIIYMFR